MCFNTFALKVAGSDAKSGPVFYYQDKEIPTWMFEEVAAQISAADLNSDFYHALSTPCRSK
jgi:hypothetical protein